MCEHTRRPKMFCILQTCTKSECCACSTCLQSIHNHNRQNYLDQKEIAYLLTRFDPPTTFKEQRKNTTIKMYKYLSKLKGQISSKLEEMINNLMSKIKYPYLFEMELLQSYRNLRDKNYQRLNPQRFRYFCKTARNVSGIDFIEKEKELYNLNLIESHQLIKGFNDKVKDIEKAFGFQLSSQVVKLHQQFISEVDQFKKVHKVSKSLEKKDYSVNKSKHNLNSSVKLEKKPMEYLTPTKPTISLDVSIQNVSFQSSGDYRSRKQSQNLKGDFHEHTLKNLQLDQVKRFNTLDQEKKNLLKVQKDSDAKTVRSSDQNKQLQQSPLKLMPKLNVSDLYNYQDDISNNYKIKISSHDDQNKNKQNIRHSKDNFLTSSIQLEQKMVKEEHGRKLSLHEQMLKMSIRDREENVKNRMSELKKQKGSDDKLNLKDSVKIKKQTSSNSKKALQINAISPSKKPQTKANEPKSFTSQKNKESINLFSSIERKVEKSSIPATNKKQTKSPKKQQELTLAQNKSNFMMNQNNKKSPKKLAHNVSLGKQFVHYQSQKSSQNITLHFRNAAKEIPIIQNSHKQASPPRKLLKKKSFQITQDQQLQASAVLISKLQEIKNPSKVTQFLQKYSQRYENCLSVVEYLSYLYLQQGKLKECFNLTTKYLQKLDYLKVSDLQKIGLAVNKSAALNQLGRYSESFSFLKKFEGVDNQKMHKNLGDALFNLGNNDRAIYHYERATKIDEKYDEAYYNLAVMLYLQESYYNAKMNIDKAVRYQPKNASYIQLLNAIKQRMASCLQ